jgi:hypothetical protein
MLKFYNIATVIAKRSVYVVQMHILIIETQESLVETEVEEQEDSIGMEIIEQIDVIDKPVNLSTSRERSPTRTLSAIRRTNKNKNLFLK